MTKRINIVLPSATLRTVDKLVESGERSRFITRAIEHYIANQSAEAVRKRLEEALVRDRDLDDEIARDWFAVDQESWQQIEQAETPRKPATPSEAKSTSRRSTRR